MKFLKQMFVIKKRVNIEKIRRIAQETFGNVVKVVVDIEKGIIALGAELHADEEAELLEAGSKQENLWGINIYPDADEKDYIEFDSLINLRPSQGNRTRGVDDPLVRQKIIDIVKRLIVR